MRRPSVIAIAAALLCATAAAQEGEAEERAAPAQPVRFRGVVVYEVRAQVGRLAPGERAAAIERRILGLQPSAAAEVRVEERGSSSDLYAGTTLVLSVTDPDAAPTGRTRQQLAADTAYRLRLGLEDEAKSRSVRGLLVSGLLALLSTGALAVLLRQLRRLSPRLHAALRAWRGTRIRALRLLGAEVLSAERVVEALVSATRLAHLAVAVVAVGVWLNVVLGLFPWTRGLAAATFEAAGRALASAGAAAVGFLPNLASLLVIAFVTRALLRLGHAVAQQVQDGRLALPGFHREWADPTYKLVRFLVVALALVLAFPFLPGSESPAFRGVSVFLGVLLSLGSASAVSNVVAGVVLVYMRPFAVGDRVRIADREGDVVERNLLVVRLRTIKQEEVTLANSTVLAAQIVNLSAAARAGGLLLHTTVTIGYDVPWRRVHELLLAAARSVDGLLAEPAPFVLQTSLNDFHVSYQVNARTERAHDLPALTSRLHEAIQDRFAEAGVEIVSPLQAAVRTGGAPTGPVTPLR